MTRRHQSGGEHCVEILGLVLAALAVRTVRAMDFVRAMEFRSVQRDQHMPVQPAHGIQAATLVQFGHDIGEHGMEHDGFHRIEFGTDLTVTGDFTHAEQGLTVRTAVCRLQMALVCQKGWALHEERGEPGQSEIRHVVGRVLAPPLVGQRPAATAQGIEEAVQNWHTPVES
jgi:hypothetical protein